MSMSLDDLTPRNSISSVVYGVLCLENIGHSLSEVEFGTIEITAVLNFNQSLTLSLSSLSSSEASEDSLLVKSDWLSFVVDLL